MILPDTSVWIDHFGSPLPALSEAMIRAEVYAHPYAVTELALGSISGRAAVLDLLDDLPVPLVASSAELRQLLDSHDLASRGIGYVDLSLLASTLFHPGTTLWTSDKRLHACAVRAGVPVANPRTRH